MTRPFRISVMQPTMEPIDELLAIARTIDRYDFHTIWLAENYPWWRNHSLEARSASPQSSLIAHVTNRVAIGWAIISPYTRHPIEIAMEARVMQEVAGPGRFAVGLGASKIFMHHIGLGTDPAVSKPVAALRESTDIVRAVLEGGEVDYTGKMFSAKVPAVRADTPGPAGGVPVYLAGTGPQMQKLAGRIADGLLTASISTPRFMEYSRRNMVAGAQAAGRNPDEVELGATCIASIAPDREEGLDGAREFAGMYLANKVRNIQGAADVLLESAGLTQDEIRPIAEAMDEGGRLAAKEKVTDEILAKCTPIAGTPKDCIAQIEAFREAGCDHVMLELWGPDRLRQIELFGEQVLPHFFGRRAA
jgi:5,10-methylenetetrahydromethanopterin reductase